MLSLGASHRHNAIGTVLVVVIAVIIVIGAGVSYVLLMRPSAPTSSSSSTSTASSTLSTTSSSSSSNSIRTRPTTSTSTASTTTATTSTEPFPGVKNNVWTGTYTGTYTETGLPGTLTATDRGQIFFNTNTHKGTGFSTVTLMVNETGQPPCQLSGSVAYSFNMSVTPRGGTNVSFVATSYSTNTIPSTGDCTSGAAQVALYGPMSNYANVELVTGAMWKFTYNSSQMEISASGTIYSCVGGLCPIFPDY